jgi:hypothetical protein
MILKIAELLVSLLLNHYKVNLPIARIRQYANTDKRRLKRRYEN